MSDGTGPRGVETPVPWDERASEAILGLRTALTGWVQVLLDEHPNHGPAGRRASDLADWLTGQRERIRHHEAALEIHDEITDAVAHAWHVIDRPADRRYLGPCGEVTDEGPCPAELYARPGAAVLACRDCGTVHDVEVRARWLVSQAQDQLLIAAHIAHALTSLRSPVTSDRIRLWRHRGRLLAHGSDQTGRPLYRVGDVVGLLLDDDQAAATRRSHPRLDSRSHSVKRSGDSETGAPESLPSKAPTSIGPGPSA